MYFDKSGHTNDVSCFYMYLLGVGGRQGYKLYSVYKYFLNILKNSDLQYMYEANKNMICYLMPEYIYSIIQKLYQ